MNFPQLLYIDSEGILCASKSLSMVVSSSGYNFLPYEPELIDIPEFGEIVPIIESIAYGFNSSNSTFEKLDSGLAVGAKLPPGFLSLYTPSAGNDCYDNILYTAVGFSHGYPKVAAIEVEKIIFFTPDEFKKSVSKFKSIFSDNKYALYIAEQAGVETWAKNIVCCRGEFYLPLCQYSLEGIFYKPIFNDVLEVVSFIVEANQKPIFSFCFTSEFDIKSLILSIKNQCSLATINFYAGCGDIKEEVKLLREGIDGVYVTIPSALSSTCSALGWKPGTISNLEIYAKEASENKVNFALLLRTYPGLNDRKSEEIALMSMIEQLDVKLLLLRDAYGTKAYSKYFQISPSEDISGIKNMLRNISKKFKDLSLGWYSRHVNDFHRKTILTALKPIKFKRR